VLVKRIAASISSTVYKRDIGRKFANFSYPLAFNAPVGGDPLDDLPNFW